MTVESNAGELLRLSSRQPQIWDLYLGVTNDPVRRVYEHRTKAVPGFTSKYGVDRLVWFECYDDPATAIAREKEIKKWRRDWKITLIEGNPDWLDLYDAVARSVIQRRIPSALR
jgi:putative endonuclease